MRAEELLAEADAALSAAGIHNSRQEAGWLLAHVAGGVPLRSPCACARSFSASEVRRFRDFLCRRVSGEPLQYILSSTEFYGLDLVVGPGVLIPRPETERLVDFALDAYPGGPVCDVCTGSGAILLALASQLGEDVPSVGVDLCAEALRYARRNRDALGLASVAFVRSDLLSCFVDRPLFGLITANPPYVSPAAYAELPVDVRDYEPRLALYAEDAGLAVVRRLLGAVAGRLVPGGVFLCEISSEQGPAAAAAARCAGYAGVQILEDYTGRDRVLRCRRE